VPYVPKYNHIGCRRIDGDKFALVISPLLSIQLHAAWWPKKSSGADQQLHFNVGYRNADPWRRTLALPPMTARRQQHKVSHSNSHRYSLAEKLLQNAEAAAKQAQSLTVVPTLHQPRLRQPIEREHKIAV